MTRVSRNPVPVAPGRVIGETSTSTIFVQLVLNEHPSVEASALVLIRVAACAAAVSRVHAVINNPGLMNFLWLIDSSLEPVRRQCKRPALESHGVMTRSTRKEPNLSAIRGRQQNKHGAPCSLLSK